MDVETTIKDANNGDASQQFNLAIMYLRGYGTIERDDQLAKFWFHKSAKQGLSQAQHNLGMILWQSGEYDDGLYWKQQAANQGNNSASQLWLGHLYYEGHSYSNVERDYDMSFKYYQLAANQGEYEALLKVGQFYHYGDKGTIQKNHIEARNCYLRNIKENNCIESCFLLGKMILDNINKENQDGEERSSDNKENEEEEARKWLSMAAKMGHSGALEAIMSLQLVDIQSKYQDSNNSNGRNNSTTNNLTNISYNKNKKRNSGGRRSSSINKSILDSSSSSSTTSMPSLTPTTSSSSSSSKSNTSAIKNNEFSNNNERWFTNTTKFMKVAMSCITCKQY